MINVYIVEILGISELQIENPNSKKHRIANPMQRKENKLPILGDVLRAGRCVGFAIRHKLL